MENIELLREPINSKINNIDLSSGITLEFGDEKINIIDKHSQDCCENVYADFSSLPWYVENLKKREVKELVIKGIKDIGFLLCFYFDYDESEKVFIPCYNNQNGYYSDSLSLIITRGNKKTEIDITQYKEDCGC